jgi:hypothetical protein
MIFGVFIQLFQVCYNYAVEIFSEWFVLALEQF